MPSTLNLLEVSLQSTIVRGSQVSRKAVAIHSNGCAVCKDERGVRSSGQGLGLGLGLSVERSHA
jgi:hypothetical protein